MKKSLQYVSVITLCILAITQIAFMRSDKNSKSDLKMSFSAKITKTEFLQLEPFGVSLEFANKTDTDQQAYTPNFLQTRIEVTNTKGNKEMFGISFITANRASFPRNFAPGEAIKEELIIITNLEKMFPEIGTYQIRFLLPATSEKVGELASEPISVKIIEATGLNAQALKEIRKNQSKSRAPDELFRWNGNNSDGEDLLENFVGQFANSIYGEFAVYKLANIYLDKGDLEKAKEQFEKIKSSENQPISADTNKALADIARKKVDLQKLQNQKEKPQ